jgi:hypothetical protein
LILFLCKFFLLSSPAAVAAAITIVLAYDEIDHARHAVVLARESGAVR